MEKEKYSMSSYASYRENIPAIKFSIRYLNQEDTENVLNAYKRVGMNEFSHSEVADLLDKSMMRKLKLSGILEKTSNKSKNYSGMWKFKSGMAYRIEQSIGDES